VGMPIPVRGLKSLLTYTQELELFPIIWDAAIIIIIK
jgi:hypothetical protein